MKKQYRNVSFLAELLINILVFSISCAVLVGLFGTASRLAAQAKEESFAGAEVNALVERVKVRGANGVTHGQWQADGSVLCPYDAEWQPVNSQDEAVYTIRLTVQQQAAGAGLLNNIVAVASTSAGEEILRIETASYQPKEN